MVPHYWLCPSCLLPRKNREGEKKKESCLDTLPLYNLNFYMSKCGCSLSFQQPFVFYFPFVMHAYSSSTPAVSLSFCLPGSSRNSVIWFIRTWNSGKPILEWKSRPIKIMFLFPNSIHIKKELNWNQHPPTNLFDFIIHQIDLLFLGIKITPFCIVWQRRIMGHKASL